MGLSSSHGLLGVHELLPISMGGLIWQSAAAASVLHHCFYFTFVREPSSRLVSALLYCRHTGFRDREACGCCIDTNVSIKQFALHWGNRMFLQLALEPSLYAAMRERASVAACRCATTWERQKSAFGSNDDASTRTGSAVLDRLVRGIRAGTLFDFIGLVERFDDSLALLDKLLPLKTSTWAGEATKLTETHGSERWKGERQTELVKIRRDRALQGYMAADTALYSAAQARFEHQIRLKSRSE